MSLADKLYEVGLKKVVDAAIAAEQLLTEAKEAADAERKRLEYENKRR